MTGLPVEKLTCGRDPELAHVRLRVLVGLKKTEKANPQSTS